MCAIEQEFHEACKRQAWNFKAVMISKTESIRGKTFDLLQVQSQLRVDLALKSRPLTLSSLRRDGAVLVLSLLTSASRGLRCWEDGSWRLPTPQVELSGSKEPGRKGSPCQKTTSPINNQCASLIINQHCPYSILSVAEVCFLDS